MIIIKEYRYLIKDSYASNGFDLLRGIAAIWVMVFHLRPIIYLGYDKLSEPNILIKGLYFFTSIGPQWVMVFFVLSGYLISSSVLKFFRNDTWSWKKYMTNRLVRLWAVLIPALLLTIIWAKFQVEIIGEGISNLGILNFMGNFLFVQGIFSPDFGENVALWSLSFEFWYYILFPCLILIIVSKKLYQKLLYVSFVLLLGFVLGAEILLYFLIWLIGTVLLFIPPIKFKNKSTQTSVLLIAVFLFFGSLCTEKIFSTILHLNNEGLVSSLPFNLIVGLCTGFLMYIMLSLFNKSKMKNDRVNFAILLSSFSYTLYLTHYPVLNFLRVWIGDGQWGTWYPSLSNLLLGFGISILLIFYAYIIASFTEFKTQDIKNKISSVFEPT